MLKKILMEMDLILKLTIHSCGHVSKLTGIVDPEKSSKEQIGLMMAGGDGKQEVSGGSYE